MKIDPEQLEIGKEYLAVDRRDPRNEVGVRVVLKTLNGIIECKFTRGTWRTVFTEYKLGDELALFSAQTDFFPFPHIDSKKCRACSAEVIFLDTEAGKKIPVNAETVLPKDRLFDSKVHRTHFADCPGATGFRKPKEKKG